MASYANATVTVAPLRNDLPAYKIKVSLTSVAYTLRFRYNTRMQRWIMDCADASNNDIVNGVPLLINNLELYQYVNSLLPYGQLIPVDNRNNIQEQPTRYSFGTTHDLLYAEAE
jgi:hypothetical protein